MRLYKLYLVAGGFAVVLAACSTATPDPTTAPPPTTVPAPTHEEAKEEMVPSVTVSDQDASAGTVTIEKVVADQPGWIVIHADQDGGPGPVIIGFAPVGVGNNSNVTVEIDLDQATETLYAMLHLDLGAAGEYEFPGEDAPVFDADGNVVLAPFALLES